MLKLYDQLEKMLVPLQEKEQSAKYICYASELTDSLQFSEEELKVALDRAFKVCNSMRISIGNNFKPVYRSTTNMLMTDWKLTSLGCYLIIINADPGNPGVAITQIHFATKNFNDVNIF